MNDDDVTATRGWVKKFVADFVRDVKAPAFLVHMTNSDLLAKYYVTTDADNKSDGYYSDREIIRHEILQRMKNGCNDKEGI